MGHREKLKSGDEVDAVHLRHVRAGVRSKIKAKMNRRNRRDARLACREKQS